MLFLPATQRHLMPVLSPRSRERQAGNRAIKALLETGSTGRHTPVGTTLAPVLMFCRENKIAFTLHSHQEGSYYLEVNQNDLAAYKQRAAVKK